MMNMKVSQFVWRATAVAALVFAACVCAAVPAARLPAILGPRAVLQAGKPVNVWGFDARPGTTLSVELSDAGTGAAISATTAVANAQGRFEAIAMAAAPLVAFAILFFLDRELMQPLVETKIGWCAIGAVAVLETVGFLVINKIVTIDV